MAAAPRLAAPHNPQTTLATPATSRPSNPTDPVAKSIVLSFIIHSWFDPVGRVVAQWGPNAPAVKNSYDGLGRVVTTYATDRGGDGSPGPGSFAQVYQPSPDHKAKVDGDVVFEQTSRLDNPLIFSLGKDNGKALACNLGPEAVYDIHLFQDPSKKLNL